MKPCPFCNDEMQISQAQPLVRCTNKACTAYHIRINKKAYKDGVIEGFVKFWDSYPKKVGKKDGITAWIKLNPPKDLRMAIVASVIAHAFNAEQWESVKFIPHPATFLRGRMWENEVIKKQIKIDPIDKLELRATPTKPPVDAMSKEYLEKIIKLTAEMMKSKDTNRKKAILQEIEGIRDKITKLKGVDVG